MPSRGYRTVVPQPVSALQKSDAVYLSNVNDERLLRAASRLHDGSEGLGHEDDVVV